MQAELYHAVWGEPPHLMRRSSSTLGLLLAQVTVTLFQRVTGKAEIPLDRLITHSKKPKCVSAASLSRFAGKSCLAAALGGIAGGLGAWRGSCSHHQGSGAVLVPWDLPEGSSRAQGAYRLSAHAHPPSTPLSQIPKVSAGLGASMLCACGCPGPLAQHQAGCLGAG